MIHILGKAGGTNVVRLGPQRYWAERGLIHQEDARDNSYRSDPVRTVLQRMQALSEMLHNPVGNKAFYRDKIEELQTYLEGMLDVCTQAKEQGMPEDPSASRDLARRRAKSVRRPAELCVHSGFNGSVDDL